MNSNISRLSAAALGLAILLTGCDNVKEGERLTDYPLPPQGGRTLVIMEFTGQNCTNCPSGAEQIRDLSRYFGDGLISVCLHPEGTTFTQQIGPVKLTSQIATEYLQHFNTQEFPYALFNNRVTDYSSAFTKWSTAIDDFSGLSSPLSIDVEPLAEFDAATGTVNITCSVKNDLVIPEGLNLNVWIVENKIVTFQSTLTGRNPRYEHNHVARTSLTGTWGIPMDRWIPVENENGETSYEFETEVSGAFDAKWVPENCDIVVFVTNPSAGQEIMQGAKCELVESGDSTEE